MKIVKCSKCGKLIHKEFRCYYCGNVEEFDELNDIKVHRNVLEKYKKMDLLLENKDYDNVIKMSYEVIKWNPQLAGVYWLRLLAKKKCSSTIELISKGVSCENDSDFCNSLAFSKFEEHEVYKDLNRIMMAIQGLLKNRILEHEIKCKFKTNITEVYNTLQMEVKSRKKDLFSVWTELERTEQIIGEVEMDCDLLVNEYQVDLQKALNNALTLKNEVYRLEECNSSQAHMLQVKLGAILEQSESSKQAIKSIKNQHPWVKNHEELVNKRDNLIKLIETKIEDLNNYEDTVQQTISKIEQIENQHKNALIAADKFDFSEGVALIGGDSFNEILKEVGIGVEASITI